MEEYKSLLQLITYESNNMNGMINKIDSTVNRKLVLVENEVIESEKSFTCDIEEFTKHKSK